MTKTPREGSVRMIPIDRIDILNSRERNQHAFEEIAANIKSIGLKKPITVSPRVGLNGAERYLLICGEGRLRAFLAMGEPSIPAVVVDVSDEDAFIMSLAENIARHRYGAKELFAGIEQLRAQGYDKKAIAQKTGLTPMYVGGLLTLLKSGEERLLVAVQRGRIPIHAALAIVGAGNDDKAIQIALQDAYDSGKLRGTQLVQARRIIERRQRLGRKVSSGLTKKAREVTTSSLVRSYQKEVERQQQVVKKAEFAQQRLLFVISALRNLFADDNFTNLLRVEGMDSLPTYLAERVWPEGVKA